MKWLSGETWSFCRVYLRSTFINGLKFIVQTRFPDVGTDTNGNATAFSGANAITGQTSSASATPNTSSSTDVNGVSITSGYSNPELAADSGDIIYVEESFRHRV